MAPDKSFMNFGSKGDPCNAKCDLKKMKRKESNRLSAQRSRNKKHQQLEELLRRVNLLKEENQSYSDRINATNQMYQNMASQNKVLRAQFDELSDRLRSMNDVIHIASEVNGVAIDTQEIPDTSHKPWQLPFPAQPMLQDPFLPQPILQDSFLPQPPPLLQDPWHLSCVNQPIAASADYFLD